MLSIRNGFASIFRKPLKAALFILILAVISALLAVSLSVFSAVRGYLNECGSFFRTIVQAEYVGEFYPEAYRFDPEVVSAVESNKAELDSLISDPGVISFEPHTNAIAVAPGIHRADKYVYDTDVAVLLVYISNEYDEMHSAIVQEELYSRRPVEGKMILIRTSAEELSDDLMPKPRGKYYLTGRYFNGISSYLWFRPEALIPVEGAGEALPVFSPVEDGLSEKYQELAELVARRNDSFPLTATSSLEDLRPFHQEEIRITDGRYFTEEEYSSNARVCVLTELTAAVLGVSVGDKVDLSVIYGKGDVYADPAAELPPAERYEVVGLCSYGEKIKHHIYIPAARNSSGAFAPVTGYTLGQFRVDNDAAASFLSATEPLREKGFRFTVYDQGYAAATAPLKELYVISVVFLGVSLLLALAALLLQNYIFVTRQKEPARVMLSLGSGKGHLYSYFLSAAALIAVPSAVIGCFVGKLLEGRVFSYLTEFTAKYSKADTRFSNSSFTLRKALDFSPSTRFRTYLIAGLILVLSCFALTALFTALVCRDPGEENRSERTKKKARKVKRPRAVSSSSLGGRFKYGLLSMRRNLVKSAVVILLALAAAAFFGRLTSSLAGYKNELESFIRDSVIIGHGTDPSGEKYEGLTLKLSKVNEVSKSDLVENASASVYCGHLRLMGVTRTAEGENFEIDEPAFPEGMFGIETFITNMTFEPKWVLTDSLENNVIFLHGGGAQAEYLPGLDDSLFAKGSGGIAGVHDGTETYFGDAIEPTDYNDPDPAAVIAVPTRFLEKHGLKLGDTVRMVYYSEVAYGPVIDYVEFIIGASYVSSVEQDIIFSPASLHHVYGHTDGFSYRLATGSWNSFVFSLKDASKLNELRDVLEQAGFATAATQGRAFDYAILQDDVYLNTSGSMERQIEYVRVLYNALYVLAMLIGFAAAWLLMSSRSKEISLMRALGTPGPVILVNFLLEQVLLLLIGLALGLALHRLTSGGFNRTQLLLVVFFFASWLLGAHAGLLPKLFGRTMESLSDPE